MNNKWLAIGMLLLLTACQAARDCYHFATGRQLDPLPAKILNRLTIPLSQGGATGEG